jgi:hypothetical protein
MSPTGGINFFNMEKSQIMTLNRRNTSSDMDSQKVVLFPTGGRDANVGSDGETTEDIEDGTSFIASLTCLQSHTALADKLAKSFKDDPKKQEALAYVGKVEFRRQIAVFFTKVYEESGLELDAFLAHAEMSRKTYLKIVLADRDGSTRIATFAPIIKHLNKPMAIRLQSQTADGAAMLFRYTGDDPALFSANIFRQCRSVAGLSRSGLDKRLAQLKGKTPKTNGYSCKVEKLSQPNGVSLGVIYDVATASGFKASIVT